MEVKQSKILLPGVHQCVSLTNEHWSEDTAGKLKATGKGIIILLHGYSESATKIYKRIGRSLNESLEDYSILALNGLYPLPRHFPLDTNDKSNNKKENSLLAGFAWYFYDQRTDQFLIHYEVPVTTLGKFLKEINPQGLPTSFIGYSQGGYLAPFVGLSYPHTQQVLGINCSFRFDLIKEKYQQIPFPLNQIQGRQDSIIDTQLCYQRYQSLQDHYKMSGEFKWVEQGDHWLDPETRDQAIGLFKAYLNKGKI